MTEGIWTQYTADKYHQSSPNLARWIATYLPIDQKVIDFGCGNGFYCHELASVGFQCLGVEGFHLSNFLHENIIIKDLTIPINLPVKGSVISLEVGEHLPSSSEQTFLDTITKHCTDNLILSWALLGQPGIGHINCRPQEYIINQIWERGFNFMPIETEEVRNNIDDQTDWFRRTIMIFKK